MNEREIKALLGLHREGEADQRFEEARERAARDPELSRWWAEEQGVDRVIAAKLASVPVPPQSMMALPHREAPSLFRTSPWSRGLLAAAAVLVALAVFFGSWRGPFRPAAALADYRSEMVSFIKVTPSLELETHQLDRITDFLAKSGAPSAIDVPKPLRELGPIGCRVLRYRGEDVTLICFRRSNGHLAHLFVLKHGALPRLRDQRQYLAEGDWMTASWNRGGYDYLVAVQGDRAAAEKLAADS